MTKVGGFGETKQLRLLGDDRNLSTGFPCAPNSRALQVDKQTECVRIRTAACSPNTPERQEFSRNRKTAKTSKSQRNLRGWIRVLAWHLNSSVSWNAPS